jgi:hypothetical protein
VDPVDQQRNEVEGVERRALPGGELRGRAGDKAATDGALARAPALHLGGERLQAPRVLAGGYADEHLFDDPTIEGIGGRHRLKRRQRDLAGGGSHPRPLEDDLSTAQDHLARRRAGPTRGAFGLVRIPRPAEGRTVLLQHGREDLQPGSQRQFQQLRLRVDEQIDEWQMAQRGFGLGMGGAMRDFGFMAAPSVRPRPRA